MHPPHPHRLTKQLIVNIALVLLALFMITLVSGCSGVSKDLGAAGKAPGLYYCAGKFTMTSVGQISMGLGANGSISGDCGSGAFFGQGYPATTLPLLPSANSPQIKEFPPLGAPPTPTTTVPFSTFAPAR